MSLHIIILSPVMPIWDRGAFCSSFTELCLARGFQITLLDTLSLFPSHSAFCHNSTGEILPFITEKLKKSFKEPSVLVGFSMAGMLVQILAARLPNVRAVLAVNAPGYPDKPLQRQIGYILTFLKEGDLSGALERLNSVICSRGGRKKRVLWQISDEQRSMAIERMIRGFTLLLGMDARGEIIKYTGKFLALIGERSQLATIANQTRSQCLNHEYKIISDAGTRLWDENPAMTNAIVNQWIDTL
ncbi:alpha/beta fold hydrolase [Bartonella senegalensis]|uniref:alpha/beta fold hydrolase n=1 Tax=Bartonella senegalensis TaxID=1468418 RepID=UPI0002E70C5C|nr:alpha/beta hydrolase [Bartonella senegalensis]